MPFILCQKNLFDVHRNNIRTRLEKESENILSNYQTKSFDNMFHSQKN